MNKQASLWQRLKQHRFLYNALQIALILLFFLLVAHFTMLLATRHGARRTVPEFAGLSLADAQQAARKNDLNLIVNDSLFVPAYEGGIVLDQLPEGGVEVKPGRKVYVTINSFKQKMVPLPYVAGRSLRQAKNMLEIAGLEIEKLVYVPDMATNYVLEEYYAGEAVTRESRRMAEAGSGVTLHVGMEEGYPAQPLPSVIGLSLSAAKGRLWENGFNVGEIHFDKGITLLNQKDARVYRQSPQLGGVQHPGHAVSLWLSLDEKMVEAQRTEAEKLLQQLAEEQRRLEQERADSLAEAALHGASDGGADSEEEPLQTVSDEELDEFFR